jgi:glutamine amidotransferase
MGLKVPHMGWNQLDVKRRAPIFRNLAEGSNVYFVHSYHVVPDDESIIATTTGYGRPFVSSIWRDNVMATQFHPEKSQMVGLGILSNFAAM